MRPDQQIDRSKTQLDGLRSLDQPLTQGAPFSADQMATQIDTVIALNARQEAAKAELHASTKSLEAQVKRLREMTARNVAFFQGVLGKTDPLLLKLGGKVARPGRRARAANPAEPDAA